MVFLSILVYITETPSLQSYIKYLLFFLFNFSVKENDL